MARPDPAQGHPRVLVVDDHRSMAESIADGLTDLGYAAVAIASSVEAVRLLEAELFDAVVTDLRMPAVDGLALLAFARKLDPQRPVIVMTAYSAVESAIESIRQGAYHYMTKPFKVGELALFLGRALDEARLRREAVSLRRALHDRYGLENLIGKSSAMRELVDLIERVADTTAPVLVVGETGTGKGLVARALHTSGSRSAGPFVAVNCAALPENLLESELFGHVKGAFTGATGNRVGLLEGADRGTLFLDEIGEMAAPLQAKLLHVLESGTVRAVGANQERRVDVRIVAATHRDLRQRVASGTFREDLLYRLDVVTIEIPALRYRKDDIPLLVEHFLAISKARHPESRLSHLAPSALERMLQYPWPGNVRELEHVLERAVILARDSVFTEADLPASMSVKGAPDIAFGPTVLPMRDLQRRYAQWAFDQLGGRKLLTAEKLGIDFKTLAKLLESGDDDAATPSSKMNRARARSGFDD